MAVINELTDNQTAFIKAFNADSQIIGEQTEKFLKLVYPSYLIDKTDLEPLLEKDSTLRLQSMTFAARVKIVQVKMREFPISNR